jgi:hypothetical protein
MERDAFGFAGEAEKYDREGRSDDGETGYADLHINIEAAQAGKCHERGDAAADSAEVVEESHTGSANRYLQKLGIVNTLKSRAIDYDIRERFWWGGEPILNKIAIGSDLYRKRIASLLNGT